MMRGTTCQAIPTSARNMWEQCHLSHCLMNSDDPALGVRDGFESIRSIGDMYFYSNGVPSDTVWTP